MTTGARLLGGGRNPIFKEGENTMKHFRSVVSLLMVFVL